MAVQRLWGAAGFAGALVVSIAVGGEPAISAGSKACIKVRNATDLDNVRNNLAGNYCQTHDIDASSIANFVPIGTESDPFTGQFDGRGYVIRNLTINDGSTGFVWTGFFGGIGIGAVVKNMGLINAHVTGNYIVGIFAGISRGIIQHSYTTGDVECTGATVNCHAAGFIGDHESEGHIDDSHSRAFAHCARNFCSASGFAGFNFGTIIQSYATGNATCQAADGDTSSCFASGFEKESRFGTTLDSYATGAASCLGVGCQAAGFIVDDQGLVERSTATGSASCVGPGCIAAGFVTLGNVDGVDIKQSYASGAATCVGGPELFSGRACRANGFTGRVFDSKPSDPEVTQSYSTGKPKCTGDTCIASGFAEFNEFTPAGQVATSYWDRQTSDVATSGGGGTRLTTSQFKSGLPAGFAATDWSIVAGLTYPWLDPRKLTPAEQEDFHLNFWAPPLASAGYRNKTFFYYHPVGQLEPFQYEKKPRQPEKASKAAVFTVLGRTTGDIKNLASLKNIFIDYYWNGNTEVTTWRGAVASRGSIFSPALGSSPVLPDDGNLTPIDFGGDDILDRLVAGSSVLIHGTSSINPNGHWMLGTSVIKDDGGTIVGVAALDPWTGRQVILNVSDWRVAFPADFETANFIFTATGYFYATIN
jgi:hypothetical protein